MNRAVAAFSPPELSALRERVAQNQLSEEDRDSLMACIDLILHMDLSLQEKKLTINKLRSMLYGSKTEKKTNGSDKCGVRRSRKSTSDQTPGKRRGRGRLGADDYTNAKQIEVPHAELTSGCECPLCGRGHLYNLTPVRKIKLTGGPPIQADCYNMEHLRCSACQGVFTAAEPLSLAQGKYTATACAMVCLLKYGTGLPLNRMDDLQAWLGVPLPASTQFQMCEAVVNAAFPVFKALIGLAADADLIHTDDTAARILSGTSANPKRKGIQTTGVVAEVNGRRIILYATGGNHAGENLSELLANRTQGLPPPIHMADALALNFDYPQSSYKANCLAHGRRQFYEVDAAFPNEVGYVLYKLGRVYENDALAREQNLTPGQRLAWHQSQSAPHMAQLNSWLCMLLEEHRIEPNSSIGKAAKYLLNHWEALTLFLRKPGVPLDNNICERALKKFVRLRKNSLFYKTPFGALVGDVLLTLIHTTVENGENPFEYLTALQTNKDAVAADPASWLPWRYRAALDAQNDAATAA